MSEKQGPPDTDGEQEAVAVDMMRGVLDATSDSILTVDSEGIIRTANPAVQCMFGQTPEGLVGTSLNVIIPEFNGGELAKLSPSAGRSAAKEFTALKDNDCEFFVEVTVSRLKPEKKKRFAVVIRDVTEQKLLHQQLHEQISQLEVANKQLEVARDRAQQASDLKSLFVANISHEIRTPMSGVLGMSELLLLSDTTDEVRQIATHIYECSKSLVGIVNDILDFSKLEAGKLNLDRMKFSISDVIDQVIQSTAHAAQQKELVINVEIHPEVPGLVWGDDGRIRQTLLNLVHNAIKFTDRGSVEIRVRSEQKIKDVATIKFLISDTGIGIDKPALDRLFRPFMQADNSMTRKYGGTGLGLSICKSLVTLMSGDIGVESEPKRGSTFWISLPLQVAEAVS